MARTFVLHISFDIRPLKQFHMMDFLLKRTFHHANITTGLGYFLIQLYLYNTPLFHSCKLNNFYLATELVIPLTPAAELKGYIFFLIFFAKFFSLLIFKIYNFSKNHKRLRFICAPATPQYLIELPPGHLF